MCQNDGIGRHGVRGGDDTAVIGGAADRVHDPAQNVFEGERAELARVGAFRGGVVVAYDPAVIAGDAHCGVAHVVADQLVARQPGHAPHVLAPLVIWVAHHDHVVDVHAVQERLRLAVHAADHQLVVRLGLRLGRGVERGLHGLPSHGQHVGERLRQLGGHQCLHLLLHRRVGHRLAQRVLLESAHYVHDPQDTVQKARHRSRPVSPLRARRAAVSLRFRNACLLAANPGNGGDGLNRLPSELAE